MKPIILSLFMPQSLVEEFCSLINGEIIVVDHREFPDGESYLRINGDLTHREVIIFDTLNEPNAKTFPLLFLAETAKELRAHRVGLVCPYLAYMRQDKRFHPGEAITSTYYGKILSQSFDWLVTVDPHLHRRVSLDEIYSIPSQVVHASEAIAAWVSGVIKTPFFIGPDEESSQWVADIAGRCQAPYVILKKTRQGDRDVSIDFPDMSMFLEHTPVLVDDIISTAKTMIKTIDYLGKVGLKPPVCIGVHGVFAGDGYEALIASRVAQVVTCNTIPHVSNGIDVLPMLIEGVGRVL